MRLAVAALVAVLAGCANNPLSTSLDPQAAKTIRTIALVDAPDPERFSAFDLGHPGMFMGIVSGIVTGSSQEKNGDRFTEELKGQGFVVGSRLSERTAQALSARGYKVVRVASEKEARQGMADAILTMEATTAGYIAPRVNRGYEPALGVEVSLMPLKAPGEYVEALYRDRFMFGWETITGLWSVLPAPETYSYRNFGELMKRSAEAAGGLTIGADLIAERVAKDLDRSR